MNKIKKTKFASYCLNGIAEGCKYCVKGRKLVLFITGVCKVGCYYCSLSEKRKNKDVIWANERECNSAKDIIEEAKASNATGAGITGGDPLLFLQRTIKYARALKERFGKRFHIHIYLPTRYATADKLGRLSKYIDEVRFHPEFLIRGLDKKEAEKDIQKIRLAGLFFGKRNIGIELPLLPDKKEGILSFILKIKDYIGFVNLNELEISDTNFNIITKKYRLKKGGYVVSGSKEAGLWILRQYEKANKKAKSRLKMHLCTAELKNWHQYKNRLKMHKILPYGKRTSEGTIIYLAVYAKDSKEFSRLKKEFKGKRAHADARKKRIILAEKLARRLINKYKIKRVEEYPTFDGDEAESEEIK